MDNTLTIWSEQNAHIRIEDDNDVYVVHGVMTPDTFHMSLAGIISENERPITEEVRRRVRELVKECNEENSFQIIIED